MGQQSMGLAKTNRFMCISLGVNFVDHEKIAKNHFETHFLKPWTPVPPLLFDVLPRPVSLGYNEIHIKVRSLALTWEAHFGGIE